MAIYLGSNAVGTNGVFTTGGSGGSVNISALNVTENGTYTAENGSAYNPVNVQVPTILTEGAIRPDAVKIQTYSFDGMLVNDLGITIPAYTTSNTVLRDGTSTDYALNPTITIAVGDGYDYYVIMRAITIPQYNTTSVAKAKMEYSVSAAMYEFVQLPGSTMYTLDGSNKTYTSRVAGWTGTNCYRILYWTSGTAVSVGTTGSYGISQQFNAPLQSSATCTIRPPTIIIRGSTTYYNSTYFNATTDARLQYKIDVYRAPKNNLNVDGWSWIQELIHANDCAQTATHTLT